jgi:hypothetical protein
MSRARNVLVSILVLAGVGLMAANCGGGGCSSNSDKKESAPPASSAP